MPFAVTRNERIILALLALALVGTLAAGLLA
jgi:hypothetical protein